MQRCVAALAALLEAMPCCREGVGTKECGQLVTHTTLDAAGDPIGHCAKHARPGGWDDDTGPFEHRNAAALLEARAALDEARR